MDEQPRDAEMVVAILRSMGVSEHEFPGCCESAQPAGMCGGSEWLPAALTRPPLLMDLHPISHSTIEAPTACATACRYEPRVLHQLLEFMHRFCTEVTQQRCR